MVDTYNKVATLDPCTQAYSLLVMPTKEKIDLATDVILYRANEVEGKITSFVKGVATKTNGKMVGLSFRAKSKSSMVRKLTTELDRSVSFSVLQASNEAVNDALRYTSVFSERTYVNGVKRAITAYEKGGYKVSRARNYWNSSTGAGTGNYKGYNMVITSPEGQKFELQFHTRRSYVTKEKLSHPLYEKARLEKDALKRLELDKEMQKVWEAVKTPTGADKI